MQADRMREIGLKREKGILCVSECVCVLPAVECVVLLFQSNFSLLDLNHLPGQILGFPTDKTQHRTVSIQMCTHTYSRNEKLIRLRKQKGQNR